MKILYSPQLKRLQGPPPTTLGTTVRSSNTNHPFAKKTAPIKLRHHFTAARASSENTAHTGHGPLATPNTENPLCHNSAFIKNPALLDLNNRFGATCTFEENIYTGIDVYAIANYVNDIANLLNQTKSAPQTDEKINKINNYLRHMTTFPPKPTGANLSAQQAMEAMHSEDLRVHYSDQDGNRRSGSVFDALKASPHAPHFEKSFDKLPINRIAPSPGHQTE